MGVMTGFYVALNTQTYPQMPVPAFGLGIAASVGRLEEL